MTKSRAPRPWRSTADTRPRFCRVQNFCISHRATHGFSIDSDKGHPTPHNDSGGDLSGLFQGPDGVTERADSPSLDPHPHLRWLILQLLVRAAFVGMKNRAGFQAGGHWRTWFLMNRSHEAIFISCIAQRGDIKARSLRWIAEFQVFMKPSLWCLQVFRHESLLCKLTVGQ